MASVSDPNADCADPNNVDSVASAAEDEEEQTSCEGALDFYARRTLTTVNCTAGRSSFVAGLAYYELGRFGFFGVKGRASVNYGRAIAAAFLFAVLSVSTSSMFSSRLTKLRLHVAQRGFVFGATPISRLAFKFYNYTYYCLSIAFMFLGFNYYPTKCGSSRSTCNRAEQAAAERNSTVECTDDTIREAGCDYTSYRWIPLGFGIIMLLMIFLTPRYILKIWKRSGGEKMSKHGELKRSKRDRSETLEEGSNDEQDTSVEAELSTYVGKACDSLANQSLFFASFTYAAMTRLLPVYDGGDSLTTALFLAVMSLCTVLSICSSHSLTVVSLFLADLEDIGGNKARMEAFARDATPLVVQSSAAFFGAAALFMPVEF